MIISLPRLTAQRQSHLFKTQSQSSRNTYVVNIISQEYNFALTLGLLARKSIPRENQIKVQGILRE